MLGAHLTGGVQHVQGALDVGIHIAVGAVVAEGDGDEGRQMIDDLLALHGVAHAVGVAHVAHEHFDLVLDLGGQGVQPAPGAEGVIQAEGLDLFALFDQFLGEMAADEAVGAGDHDGMCHTCAPFLMTGSGPGFSQNHTKTVYPIYGRISTACALYTAAQNRYNNLDIARIRAERRPPG